jgi:hypothetical protein
MCSPLDNVEGGRDALPAAGRLEADGFDEHSLRVSAAMGTTRAAAR